ncbi:nucleoside-triphosphatase THEP1 [Flavobacterium sp. 2755]|uniref:hypothetical protein n=1 Tax=Flavobacterium sp. 2755 TaxID=2817765 RepID=UPI002861D4AD|nr:hypothetical protein [Flavobacterium sp. 2755]MDR6761627.1 nucleoside-triphosphatase THEP1 [Flavobacterium sp. 2755]
MIISRIVREGYVYFNLHAEQTISSTFYDGDIGIEVSEIFGSALSRIDEDILLINDISEKAVYLDFIRIDNAYKNLDTILMSLSKKCKIILLLNLKDVVYNQLQIELISGNIFNKRNSDNSGYEMFYFEKKSIQYEYIFEDEIFQEEFKNLTQEFTEKNINEFHQSSSVYLPKYINIKKMISRRKNFFIFSLYQLSIKIKKLWLDNISIDNEELPILICQNLNSSFISSILSSLLKLDVIILDHLGPVNTMYSSLNSKIEENKKYIIVSDVVCLGTEVKIAKNLITFLGGKVYGSVSVVRINTLEDKHLLELEKKVKTISVFSITKENNQGIDFEIKTLLN